MSPHRHFISLWAKIERDDAFMLAGAIAWGVLFAIIPILALGIGLTGFVLSARFDDPTDAVVGLFARNLPQGQDELARALHDLVQEVMSSRAGLTIAGSLVFVWLATPAVRHAQERPRDGLRDLETTQHRAREGVRRRGGAHRGGAGDRQYRRDGHGRRGDPARDGLVRARRPHVSATPSDSWARWSRSGRSGPSSSSSTGTSPGCARPGGRPCCAATIARIGARDPEVRVLLVRDRGGELRVDARKSGYRWRSFCFWIYYAALVFIIGGEMAQYLLGSRGDGREQG